MMYTVFVLLVLLPAAYSNYVNGYDQPFVFQCPTGHSISNIRSRHNNHYEDRQYGFSCKKTPGLGRCSWSGYVNNFDERFLFQCPDNGVISGVYSYHQNHQEDRRFKFLCCHFKEKVMKQCAFSGYVNGFDAPINYRVKGSRVLKGVSSYHSNHHEDRRFKFETCIAN